MASTSYILLCILIVIFQSDCWIINNVDYVKLLKTINNEDNEIPHSEMLTLPKLSLIYPGTKWCGMGNVADNYDDLGTERQADLCCREHDFCPDYMLSGETKFNLTNDAFYVRLSCTCDEKFRKCLKAAGTTAATNVGHVYFDLISTKCYRKEFPSVKCIKQSGFLQKKCVQHKYNTTAEKVFQWFDVNNFSDP